MKQYNSLLLVVMFLVLAQGMFWSCNPSKKKDNSKTQKIFVRYAADSDLLYFRDTRYGSDTLAHNHVRKVKAGITIIWQRIGNVKFEFDSVTPKDSARNPFDKIIQTGKKLEVTLKPASDLDTGTYYYTIYIIYNSDTLPFDPILQIHH